MGKDPKCWRVNLRVLVVILMALCGQHPCTVAETVDSFATNRIIVGGILPPGEDELVYSFAWNQLPFKITWDGDTENFPADLGNLVSKARNHLFAAGDSTAELQPASLQLYRKADLLPMEPSLKRQLRAHGISAEQFYQQWFLAIPFSGHQSALIFRDVVSSLDGTLAEVQHRRPYAPRNLYEVWVSPGPSAKAAGEQAEAEIAKPDFSPPDVLWNPLGGSFPMDLRAETAKARRHLAGKYKDCGPLKLRLIDFHTFRQSQKPPTHWSVGFTFTNSKLEPYSVIMLLDGRIIGVGFTRADPEGLNRVKNSYAEWEKELDELEQDRRQKNVEKESDKP